MIFEVVGDGKGSQHASQTRSIADIPGSRTLHTRGIHEREDVTTERTPNLKVPIQCVRFRARTLTTAPKKQLTILKRLEATGPNRNPASSPLEIQCPEASRPTFLADCSRVIRCQTPDFTGRRVWEIISIKG